MVSGSIGVKSANGQGMGLLQVFSQIPRYRAIKEFKEQHAAVMPYPTEEQSTRLVSAVADVIPARKIKVPEAESGAGDQE